MSRAMANVVVLIPPAVDMGEPPIHIYTIMMITEMLVSVPRSNDAKPAVRGTVARKNEVQSLPHTDSSLLNTPAYSVTKKSTVPPITSMVVSTIAMTVLEVRVRV